MEHQHPDDPLMFETQEERDHRETLKKYPGNAYMYSIFWVEEPKGGWPPLGQSMTPLQGEWRAQSPGFPYGHDKDDPRKALAMARKIVEEKINEGFNPNK